MTFTRRNVWSLKQPRATSRLGKRVSTYRQWN